MKFKSQICSAICDDAHDGDDDDDESHYTQSNRIKKKKKEKNEKKTHFQQLHFYFAKLMTNFTSFTHARKTIAKEKEKESVNSVFFAISVTFNAI